MSLRLIYNEQVFTMSKYLIIRLIVQQVYTYRGVGPGKPRPFANSTPRRASSLGTRASVRLCLAKFDIPNWRLLSMV